MTGNMASRSPTAAANNLDLLRFLLAFFVFLSHAHLTSGHAELSILSTLFSSLFAVQAFFVISGFLIFQSFDRSSSVASYAGKRVRRILPAYLLVVLACAIGLAAISRLPAAGYFGDRGFFAYLAANLVFLNFLAPTLPGVFEANPMQAVNGSLWTLKVEVMFYVAVPFFVWACRRLGHDRVLGALFLLSCLYGFAVAELAHRTGSAGIEELGRQLPGQLTFFVAGSAIYVHFDAFRRRLPLMAAIGVGLFLLSWVVLPVVLRPLGVALMTLSFAFGPFLGRFGRFGDFSYGVYIVHFPILQILISQGVLQDRPWTMLALATVLVLAAAAALWHGVEKRFLRRDSHYRKVEDARRTDTGMAASALPAGRPLA